MDHPFVRRLIEGLEGYSDRRTILIPSLGGSLPMHMFEEILKVPVVGLPIANHDNNQHQADENIRIGHLWTAIETFAAVLMMDGGGSPKR